MVDFTTTAGGASPLPGFTTTWANSFDNGLGNMDRTWGHVWVHDGEATISSWAGEAWAPSGMMQSPTGPGAGQGFGLYSITAATDANEGPGAFACLWPASDVWPGPELDLFEKQGPDSNGNGYSTIHWKDGNGGDSYQPHMFTDAGLNVDMSQPHVYSMDWQADHISLYVDGQHVYTQTENVPQDYAHGGENEAFGAGMQPAWAAGQQNGDNVLHVYEMSYAQASGGGSPAPAPAPLPAPGPVATPSPPTPAPPVTPAPQAPEPATPQAPAGHEIHATAAADVFAFHSGDGYAAGGGFVVAGFAVGEDRLDVQAHAVGDWTYQPWSWEADGGTYVQWSWGAEEKVFLAGVTGASMEALTHPDGAPAAPPAPPTPDAPPPAEPATPPAAEAWGSISGGAGRDALNLDHLFRFEVDGGAGRDSITLGADHGEVHVILAADETKGDVITGFDPAKGDVLEFHGFGDGSIVKDLAGDFFKVIDADGHAEKFQVVGHDHLAPGDFVFA